MLSRSYASPASMVPPSVVKPPEVQNPTMTCTACIGIKVVMQQTEPAFRRSSTGSAARSASACTCTILPHMPARAYAALLVLLLCTPEAERLLLRALFYFLERPHCWVMTLVLQGHFSGGIVRTLYRCPFRAMYSWVLQYSLMALEHYAEANARPL